jgi:hypothetical protein
MRHGAVAVRARPRRHAHGGARLHAQRPPDLPRRFHLHAGRFHLCVCLQQPQQGRRGRRLQHRIPQARAAGRRADLRRRGADAAGPPWHLRHEGDATSAARSWRCSAARAQHSGHGRSRRRWHEQLCRSNPSKKPGVDELRALQLKRLQATLRHAYRNSPAYRAKFDAAGVHPDDCQRLADLAKFPVHHQEGPARRLPVWHVCRAARAVRAHPRLQRHHRQTHRGWLHEERHRHLGRCAWRGASAPAAPAPATWCT